MAQVRCPGSFLFNVRSRVLFAVILAGLVAIAGLFLLKRSTPSPDHSSQSSETSNPGAARANTIAKSADISPDETSIAGSAPVSVSTPDKPGTGAFTPGPARTWATPEKAAYIRSTVNKLDALGLENDPASYTAIVSQFTNSIPTIRKAAREAAVQFGSRDAIPKLKEAGAAVEDPREKVEFLDAADFLELPSARERAAAPKTNGQVLVAPSHQNRPIKSPQSTPVPTEP